MLSNRISKLSPGTVPAKAAIHAIHFSPILAEVAKVGTAEVFARMKTRAEGSTDAEAARRLEEVGPNVVVSEKHRGWPWRLLTATRNPLVILLVVLAGISFATGDTRAGTVMALMVILGVTLRFVQESRAGAAAAKLKAMITVTAAVVRSRKAEEIPLKQLVPGDVVTLCAGDMIPADVRVIAAKDLFITQAALTGESLPVEKCETVETREGVSPLEFANICFLGTSVESGAATAVVLATGAQTYFGSMAGSIVGVPVETSFDKGVKDFTWLMISFILVMVPLVFLINGFTKHNWREAFFFSVAVAVGVTPEMLPMIVSVCLSKGALAMSRKKVIVKQLSAIQNFGAMDVLCTDKTGTLTMDQVILERHCDVMQNESEDVLLHAYLISHFQTGLRNVLDRAVLAHREAHEKLAMDQYRKVDEIPFDFVRRMMSVVAETPDKDHQLLTKGAPTGSRWDELKFENPRVFRWLRFTLPPSATSKLGKVEFYADDRLLASDSKGAHFRVFGVDGEQSDRAIGCDLFDSAAAQRVSFKPVANDLEAPTDVTMQSTRGAVIRYTLDASWPTPENGQTYSAPIHVDKNTTFSAVALLPDRAPSLLQTTTYLLRGEMKAGLNTAHIGNSLTGTTNGFWRFARTAGYDQKSAAFLRPGALTRELWALASGTFASDKLASAKEAQAQKRGSATWDEYWSKIGRSI